MDRIFKDQIGLDLEVYVDNMVAKSAHGDRYCAILTRIFDVLRKHKLKLNQEKCSFRVQVGKFLGYMLTRRGIKANSDKSIERALPVFQSLRRSERFQWTEACESAFQELKAMLISPLVLSKPKEVMPIMLCHFGLPGIIVLDNDIQFTSQLVAEFCSQLGIKQAFTFVEHPQSYGQVESANRVILRGFRRRQEEAKGR
ncbi:hypothetical protein CR513_52433, partial [Mucuna pruriens]